MNEPSWIGHDLGGRYRIEELLGQGGMSAVYKATDPNLRRVVAVKLIHPHLSTDPEFVRRFEEEAAAVARLRHPNIIQVFDFNHDGNTYYMVLEFIPGETLQQRLRRYNASDRRLTPQEAVDILAPICDAVDFAHQQSLIHRDIKPANIMINVQGQPILTDFGIVKIIGGQTHTASGAVVGTALYMSPEQAQGRRPDERSDIYSLGVTLFEMLSGRPPFEGDSAVSIMMKHVTDPVPRLRDIEPGTPPDLQAVVEKALAKDPMDRYQSAAEMAAALRRASLDASATIIEAASEPAQAGETFIESASYPEPARVAPAPPQVAESAAPPAPATRQGAATRQAPPSAERPSGGPNFMLIGGIALGAILLIGCVVGGIALASSGGLLGIGGAADVPTLVSATEGPTQEAAVAATEEPTPTEGPTAAPTEEPTPTPTPLPDLFVQITGIALEGATYVVSYETNGFTEQLPGAHIHFFFNTVAPENAGMPGSGPWYLYGGPRPFRGYTIYDKPAGATQMCALYAYPDHSIELGTGNCWYLPDALTPTP